MAARIRPARTKLSYPLYAADFDPSNADFLVVGGGGGATSSGIPNKISLIDASRFTELKEAADIELASNEDSVSSLAVASSTETALTTFAGINSSVEDQGRGRNEHFRSFQIGLPARKRRADGDQVPAPSESTTSGTTVALSRLSLFRSPTGPKNETYQRLIRLSPAVQDGTRRVAAIATGLASQNEILTFNASASPKQIDVISRINLETGEASDADLTQREDGEAHVLAYCTDTDVYLQSIPVKARQKPQEPVKVHNSKSSTGGGKIRALRWLNARYLLLLTNQASRMAVELSVLKNDQDYTQAQVVLVKRLRKTTKKAVGLAVCGLSKSGTNDQQFVIAVAAQDSSLEIMTLNYSSSSGMDKITSYVCIPEVHSGPVTAVVFSTFIPPKLPVSKETRPQYIKLASVGVDQTVVVHTIALRPYPANSSRSPRYFLVPPSAAWEDAQAYAMAFLIVALTAVCMQIFCEVRGAVPPILGATQWLSPDVQRLLAYSPPSARGMGGPGPVISESISPIIETASSTLSAFTETATDAIKAAVEQAQSIAAETTDGPLLSVLSNHPEVVDKKIVMREVAGDGTGTGEAEVQAELHHEDSEHAQDETLKPFEKLPEKQKKLWLKKLQDAGHWSEAEGLSVLKGILFSELGGIVRAAMG